MAVGDAADRRTTHTKPANSRIEMTQPKRFKLFRDQDVELPPGMTMADWTVEKIRWQNPRIRAFLGCIRLLGGVLESNYAILHCSPERLREIWRKVRQVAELIRTEISPLLHNPSRFPDLEAARQRTELALEMLTDTVLTDLDRFPIPVPTEQLIEVRKLLCVSIGKIHSFLQDAFGEMMANDPRSSRNADYFLSRRFPQDLEEAEWLHATVSRLHEYIDHLDRQRRNHLSKLVSELEREQIVPSGSRWEATEMFLDMLLEILTPKLKEVLALRGIRFYEMEILDRYADEIPAKCRVLKDLQQVGRAMTAEIKSAAGGTRPEREQGVQDLVICHGVVSRRMAQLMGKIDKELRDFVAFVPIWLDSIGKRRALLLKRSAEAEDHDEPSEDTVPMRLPSELEG